MLGPYAALLVFVVGVGAVAWRSASRQKGPTGEPGPVLGHELALAVTAGLLTLGILVVLAWAPSVTESRCTEELLQHGRCSVSALSGASGLLLFLLPLGVGSAYLWREGTLRPTAEAEQEAATPAPTEVPDAEEPSTVVPKFRCRIDGEPAKLRLALAIAASRLRGQQAAVVLSGRLPVEVNEKALALAEVLGAQKFLMATEGPHAQAVRDLAPNLIHVDELALLLAGGFVQGVVLIDGHAEFHELTLAGLGRLGSIALAEELTPSAEACAIMLAVAEEDPTTAARPRAELIDELIARVSPSDDDDAGAAEPVSGSTEPTTRDEG